MGTSQQRQQPAQRQGRQRATGRAVPRGRRVQVTLGELIAAAFEVAGGEAHTVAHLLSSPDMARATGRRFVVTG